MLTQGRTNASTPAKQSERAVSGPVAERTAVRPCVVQGPLFLSPNNPIGANSTTITEGVNAIRITVEIRVNE